MATVYRCDKCQKEVHQQHFSTVIVGNGRFTRDLCHECVILLRKWLDGEPQ